MDNQKQYTFYDHLNSIFSSNAHDNFLIKMRNKEFSKMMLAQPELISMTMMFITREFSPDDYSSMEGEPIKTKFENYIDNNLTEEEYNHLLWYIFKVKNNER